jgi:hypothetical protein
MQTTIQSLLLLTLIGLLHQGTSWAEEPKELASLRDSWRKARSQATSPIDVKYREALEAMKIRFTKAGDLASALAVDREVNSLSGSSEGGAAPAAGKEGSDRKPATRSGLEKFLGDTTWSVVRDSDQKPWPDVTFKSDGRFTGFNKTDIPWEVTAKDRVDVQVYSFMFSEDLAHFTVVWGATGQLTGTLKPR